MTGQDRLCERTRDSVNSKSAHTSRPPCSHSGAFHSVIVADRTLGEVSATGKQIYIYIFKIPLVCFPESLYLYLIYFIVCSSLKFTKLNMKLR